VPGTDAQERTLPAGFGALRDNPVYASVRGLARLPHGVDLMDDLRSDGMGSLDEVARVAEGERDDGRPGVEGDRKRLLVQQRHNVVHGKRPVGQLPQAVELPSKTLCRLEDGTDAPQGPRIRGARHKLRRSRWPDRCLDDGVLNPEQVT
jgi:hypothetical protein